MNGEELLKTAKSVLVIDWPSRDVPESLARAGLQVVVQGGPGPEDYSLYSLKDGNIVVTRYGRLPQQVDFVYSYRPLAELDGIIGTAGRFRARAIWSQSGFSSPGLKTPNGCWISEDDLRHARDRVEAAGLEFVTSPYIGDVARSLTASA